MHLLVCDNLADETRDGVKIFSTKFQAANRIQRFLYSGKKLFREAIKIDAEIYHLHDPDLLFVGNKLKKLGKKVIFDSHEDYPADIANKEWLPRFLRKMISRAYATFEKKSISKYDAVISVSPHIVERLVKINHNSYLVTNYPIWTNQEIQQETKNDSRSTNICFAGTINRDWNHHIVMDAIQEIENIKYIVAGPTDEAYLLELKNKQSWEKVDYRGVVTPQEVKSIYRESKIGLALHYSNSLSGRGTLGNTKLFEFMAAGLPLVCSYYPLWDEIIQRHNCGISVNPLDAGEVKRAIEYIIGNPDKARVMAENGIRAVEKTYNWGTQEETLLRVYSSVCERE